MTLLEFQSNVEREKAFALMQGKTITDSTGASLTCKRAKTSEQRDRNTKLQKAEQEIKKQCSHGEEIKIEWSERRVTCKVRGASASTPVFIQNKTDSSGEFLSPFANVQL